MVNIGVDFDNTIACYDAVYEYLMESGDYTDVAGIVADATKVEFKKALIWLRGEDAWTELQGRIYGPLIENARPFDGCMDVLETWISAGFKVSVVSHKTRRPILGPSYDLHRYCRDWLASEFMGRATAGQVAVTFFERKTEKVDHICRSGFDVFVDDLPEIVSDISESVPLPIWFNQSSEAGESSWQEIARSVDRYTRLG